MNKKPRKIPVYLENIQKDLDLPALPEHIECIDNSHIQGHEPVSSVVVFKNAKPSKKDYRLFNLNTVKHSDDYGAMKEVVERRYRRLADNGENLPGLLLIDGGKGQLNTTVKVLEELHLTSKIAVRSIAKRLEEIYRPGDPYPLHINKKSQTLRVLQHLRDEAHRFAINHHRKRRMKSGLDSILNDIPGIGQKSITSLLTRFRSVQGIREAGFEEIKTLIGPDKAGKVFNYITQSDQQDHQTDPRNKKGRQ
jgi:excinuclease ABC subunit C